MEFKKIFRSVLIALFIIWVIAFAITSDYKSRMEPSAKSDEVTQTRPFVVGDTLEFGTYKIGTGKDQYVVDKETHVVYWERPDFEAVEPLNWKVVEVDRVNKKMLLMTTQIIDRQDYDSTNSSDIWGECSLREWLNNEFYNEAFTDEEKNKIIKVNNPSGDKTTEDMVFIPFIKNKSDPGLGWASPTNYAYYQGAIRYGETGKFTGKHQQHYPSFIDKDMPYGIYWCTGPDGTGAYCLRLNVDLVKGPEIQCFKTEYLSDRDIGVRPQIWISIE